LTLKLDKNKMEKFTALGLMSGSSLDGLDIAHCEFCLEDGKWDYKIIEAKTFPYGEEWMIKLRELPNENTKEITKANIEYGKLTASFVNKFIRQYKLKPDLIASHGHTIFHEPAKGFTLQIGDGLTIAKETGIKTICDFRTKDISLGGQGAPLVPIGDKLLFNDYNFCLNIGGIANISFEENGQMTAFDICGANQILNHLSLQAGKPYDENGNIASLGKMNRELFKLLNSDLFLHKQAPKSLSNQYVKKNFINVIDEFNCPLEDKLFTVVKHIAFQTNIVITHLPIGKLLVSGGGTHNSFLITALKRETKHKIIVPHNEVIDFKVALIFAFMGVLRNLNLTNCLASVTGAKSDCSSGVVFLPD